MKIIKFLRDWTLPVAISAGVVIYLLFATLPLSEGFFGTLSSMVDFFMPLCMFLVLFVTFCKVDFHRMRLVPWHLGVSVFQLLLTVLIVGLVVGFDITGAGLILMESVLLCNINPCATAAAVVVKKIGGDMEQMTAFTFLSNIIAAVLIPIFFPMIDRSADMTFLEAFLIILDKVFMLLVTPMILAYLVKHFMRGLHRRIVSVKDLAYYLWASTLMFVTGVTVKNIVHAAVPLWLLSLIAVFALVICVFQFAAGRYIGHYMGNPVNTGQALGQKNTTIAIWLACTYLNPVSAVGPGCYILWQNIINSIEIWHYGRTTRK